MKKSIILFSIILLVGSLWSPNTFAQKKTQYWVVQGYEARYEANYRQVLGSIVISNVVRSNCEYVIGKGVTNQFNEYYKAYYANSRGFSGLVREIAFGPYKTWDEAEKQKRKLLGEHSRSRYGMLTVDRFSYLCD